MNPLTMVGEASASATQISEFVTTIMSSATSTITLADIALIISAIIGGGLVVHLAWTYARKGYNFIVNSLKGKKATM